MIETATKGILSNNGITAVTKGVLVLDVIISLFVKITSLRVYEYIKQQISIG